MKKIFVLGFALLFMWACNSENTNTTPTSTSTENTIGGGQSAVQDDESAKDVVKVAASSPDHTTLVAAVKQAGLVDALSNAGPFTVFAPTNVAFDKLPAGTVDHLVKAENKAALTKVLTYHVVKGNLDSKELLKLIKKGNGSTELTTVQGEKLWIMQKNNSLWLKDETGAMARITVKDVYQSNGVIHVIDTVVMPK